MSELPVKKWLQVSTNVSEARIVELRKMFVDKLTYRTAKVFEQFEFPLKSKLEADRFHAKAMTMQKRMFDWVMYGVEFDDERERFFIAAEFVQLVEDTMLKINFKDKT